MSHGIDPIIEKITTSSDTLLNVMMSDEQAYSISDVLESGANIQTSESRPVFKTVFSFIFRGKHVFPNVL